MYAIIVNDRLDGRMQRHPPVLTVMKTAVCGVWSNLINELMTR